MINSLAQIESTGCDLPHTRRGLERRMALLLSANTLFLKHGYDAVSLDDMFNTLVVLRLRFISILAIKMVSSLQSVIIAVSYSLKISVALMTLQLLTLSLI